MTKLEDKQYKTELDKIRTNVVKSLYEATFLIAFVATGIYLRSISIQEFDFDKDTLLASFIFTVAVTIALGFCRLLVNVQRHRFFLYFLIIIYTIAILFASTQYGIEMPVLSLIFAITLLSIVIVLGFKVAFIYLLAILALMTTVTYLQLNGYVPFRPDLEPPDFSSVLILFTCLFTILRIGKVGFNEIGNYYRKALEYSKELEHLNHNLDQLIHDRAKALQMNFNKQIESIYDTAVIGSIAKPLLHDLTTPFSGLEGTLEIIKENKVYDEELISLATQSVKEINNIIFESREMMRGKNLVQVFSLNDHIERVIKILKNEFISNSIRLKYSLPGNYKVKGIVSLFERILINLLVNGIEELKHVNGERVITIRIYQNQSNMIVEIMDNGRGIPQIYWNKIFEEDYSTKHSYYNLGLGLPFVRTTMREKFQGEVLVESVPNTYTRFILKFKEYTDPTPNI